MFAESIGGGISFEMEVIFLICDLNSIIFGIVTFFINKHRNLCLKEICLLSMSTYNLFFYYYSHFHEEFCVTAKPELNILLSKCAIIAL